MYIMTQRKEVGKHIAQSIKTEELNSLYTTIQYIHKKIT